MKISSLLLLILVTFSLSMTFNEVITNLNNLEKYINLYIQTKSSKDNAIHLLTCYIRKGKYDDSTWTIAGGDCSNDLNNFISEKDKSEGTNVASLRKLGDFFVPSIEQSDFVHMFAVMNGIENSNSFTGLYAHLVGWAGDLAQLVQDIMKKTGTLSELMIEAEKLLGVSGQFGQGDLVADLDAPIILREKMNDKSKSFSELFSNFYQLGHNKKRVKSFVKITFPKINESMDLDKFTKVISDVYSDDLFIRILECKYGIRSQLSSFSKCYLPGEVKSQFVNHRIAAINVFAKYLYQKYIK